MEADHAGHLDQLGQLDGVGGMASADHDHGLGALGLELVDVALAILGRPADGVEDEDGGAAATQVGGEPLELVGEHGRLRDHADLLAERGQRVDVRLAADDMALALGVAQESDDLGVGRVAEDDGGEAALGVEADLAGDDADVRAGGVAELEPERLEVGAALGRDAVGADDHDRSVLALGVDRDVGRALVIPDLADALLGQDLHHLAVVDEGAVGVDGMAAGLGVVARDVDGALDTPAETGGLGPEDLHGPHCGGGAAGFKADRRLG